MARNMGWLVVLGVLAGPSWLMAEDTYTIKVKEGGKGDTLQVDKTSNDTTEFKVADATGKALQNQEQKKTETFTYQETILEKAAGDIKATRAKRHYDKARVTLSDKTETFPFEGKTVLIDKKGDAYHFQIEGGDELTGKDAEPLAKDFNDKVDLNKLLLPKNPVKVNDSWKVDPESLMQGLDKESKLQIDTAKATATGKLVRVYEKDGHPFGVMEFLMEFPIKGFEGGPGLQVKEGSKMTMKATVDSCIDGSVANSHSKMTMEAGIQGELTTPNGDKFQMTVGVHADAQESEKEGAAK